MTDFNYLAFIKKYSDKNNLLKMESDEEGRQVLVAYKMENYGWLFFKKSKLKKVAELVINNFSSNTTPIEEMEQYIAYCTSGFNENPMEDEELNLLHCMIGLGEEVGEMAGVIKKSVFHSQPIDQAKMLSEAGDVLWYYSVLLHKLGFTYSQVMTYNRLKLADRYPNGRTKNYQIRNSEPYSELLKKSKEENGTEKD